MSGASKLLRQLQAAQPADILNVCADILNVSGRSLGGRMFQARQPADNLDIVGMFLGGLRKFAKATDAATFKAANTEDAAVTFASTVVVDAAQASATEANPTEANVADAKFEGDSVNKAVEAVSGEGKVTDVHSVVDEATAAATAVAAAKANGMQPAEGLNVAGFVTQANGIYGTGDWVAVTSASTVVVDAAQASAGTAKANVVYAEGDSVLAVNKAVAADSVVDLAQDSNTKAMVKAEANVRVANVTTADVTKVSTVTEVPSMANASKAVQSNARAHSANGASVGTLTVAAAANAAAQVTAAATKFKGRQPSANGAQRRSRHRRLGLSLRPRPTVRMAFWWRSKLPSTGRLRWHPTSPVCLLQRPRDQDTPEVLAEFHAAVLKLGLGATETKVPTRLI
jgi:hypothetical protein